MSKQQLQALFTYTFHTNRRLLEQARLMDQADYATPSHDGRGSVHELFFHLFSTLRGWRVGLESGQQPPRPSAADFATLNALHNAFAQEEIEWLALLDRLSDAQIAGTIALTTVRGDSVSFDMWRILHHLVLHGMQHHTEIAALLTSKNLSPGDIDFIFFRG